MSDKLLTTLQSNYKKLEESFLVGDRVRTLFKENENPNFLKKTIEDISTMLPSGWVLAGGLAIGFHATPRGTDDVDIMLYSEAELPAIKVTLSQCFKDIPHRKHAMKHKETGVELELLTPEFLKVNPQIMKKAIDDAIVVNGIRIITKEGLVATKLCRGDFRDLGDIETLIKTHGVIDISGYEMSDKQLERYKMVVDKVAGYKGLEDN